MSWLTLQPSCLSTCAVNLVVFGLFAIGDGRAVRAAEPTPQAAEQGAADDGNPRDAPASEAPIELEANTVIAIIDGKERILLDDVIGDVYKEFAPTLRRTPREQRPLFLNRFVYQHVRQLILIKVLLSELRRKVREEELEKVWKQVEKIFDERALPDLIEERKLETAAALDAQLKSEGSSLEKQKQKFVEQQLVLQFWSDQATVDKEVAPEELYEFYETHYDEYRVKARVRWEQLLVNFSGRTKQEARQLIGDMADQVRAGGAWQEVAKARSEGATAAEGGRQDWTCQGSLKFAALDQALFDLPVGVISPILENERGVQIVRVVERTKARVIPLEEKQDEIRKLIVDERITKAKREFLLKLLEEYRPRVWTIWDENKPLRFPSPPGP